MTEKITRNGVKNKMEVEVEVELKDIYFLSLEVRGCERIH